MKYLCEDGLISVEVHFGVDDIVSIMDGSCSAALTTFRDCFGERMKSDAFLRDDLGVLRPNELLSSASGDIWFVNGVQQRSVSMLSIFCGFFSRKRTESGTYIVLKTGIPRNLFTRTPTHRILPIGFVSSKTGRTQPPRTVR